MIVIEVFIWLEGRIDPYLSLYGFPATKVEGPTLNVIKNSIAHMGFFAIIMDAKRNDCAARSKSTNFELR